MAIFIDLDGDENNESKDLAKKIVERELENINKMPNIINASEEALKAAQSNFTKQDALMKEAQEKILKKQKEDLYKTPSWVNPTRLFPSKKSDKPLIVNNTNITYPLVEQKKWYERPLGILCLSIVASLLAGLLFLTYSQP